MIRVNGRIEHLSLAALRMAASASSEAPGDVAHWLYRFGTVPRGPAIDRDFGPDDDPMAVLGITVGGGARRLLEPAYEATSFAGWYSFARNTSRVQLVAVCKLYLSPRPEALAEAFPRIADEFVRSDVRSFKVGRGIEGLLRPDKIIAYFDDRAHMQAVAGALAQSLWGCPTQGVPFTTDAGGNGLLSSGVDPSPGTTATSWRAWVTKRLAASLTARCAAPCEERVEGALADIRMAGVDPETWHPNADAFRDEDSP
jgi:hypothetical protein